MKFLTTNFVKCAVNSCAVSMDAFPLLYQECTLVRDEAEFNPVFIVHMLERLDWDAVVAVAHDLGNTSIPQQKPNDLDPIMEDDIAVLADLHELLVNTHITEGKMICRCCGHIYHIKNSIPNFLLPPHLC